MGPNVTRYGDVRDIYEPFGALVVHWEQVTSVHIINAADSDVAYMFINRILRRGLCARVDFQ